MLNQQILKEQIGGINAKLDFTTVQPFAVFSERWFADQVGQPLMDYVAANVNLKDNTPEASLVNMALSCMSWRAYELAFPHLKLRVGDLGILKVNSQNTTAVAKWEYVDSKEANLAMLDLALENFWQTVETVKPAAWLTSDAYKKRQKVWIRSATELAEHVPTLGRKSRLFEQLLTYVQRAERIYIKPILTDGLYWDLKGKWSTPATAWSMPELEVLDLIRPAVAHLALYEAYPYLPLTLDTTGITESRSKDGTMEQVAPGADAKNTQKRQLYQDGQYYLGELNDYLKLMASMDVFPDYYQAQQAKPNQASGTDFTNESLVIL